jgi:hypothetical protein
VKGFDRESKFFFNLAIDENKSVGPATIRKMLEDLKKETKGEEDYPYNSMVIDSITGTVEKAGEKWTLVARGSKQKYELVSNAALKKLVDSGKATVTVGGKVSDDQSILKLEIFEAKEAAK